MGEWQHKSFALQELESHDVLAFHDQQAVSDTTLFLCPEVWSITSHFMTTRKWVTLIYFFARQSHQLCLMTLIPWPTVCEWHQFIWLSNSLIQSHPMTNSMWMALLYFFPTQAVWPIMSIKWQIGSEWQCFISLPGSLMTHQLAFLIPWPTGCEWHWRWFISLPGSIINHVSSPWPTVSEWHCDICLPGISSILSHPMTNRM